MQFSVFISSIGVTYEACIWGVAHLAVALVGDLAYSHHTALFYMQALRQHSLHLCFSHVLLLALLLRFTQSLTSEAFLLLLFWQSRARDILINTSAVLDTLLSRALGGHLVAFVDLLSCCSSWQKSSLQYPFYCACIASAAVHWRACALSSISISQ